MTIKRYDIHDDGVYVSMEPRETGRFVKHDDHLAALRREREPVKVKPLRYFDPQGDTFDQMQDHARQHPLAKKGDMKLVWVNEGDLHNHVLAALEPDPAALALVAAAYRDAADVVKSVRAMLCAEEIRAKTPADAQAALTAIERVAYERGVRDALTEAVKEAKGSVTIGGQRFLTAKLDDLEPAFLALLTQEGR